MLSLPPLQQTARPTAIGFLIAFAFVIISLPVHADDAATETAADVRETPPRLVPILGHQLRMDQWPVYGSMDSGMVLVKMFDYTCSHCRTTHQAIAAAKRGGLDLAVVALPVPLHRSCNDAAQNSDPSRAKSCEIARIAVAVWLADRGKFNEYHEWLFERERNSTEARDKAIDLVGREALDAQIARGTPSKYISKHVTLYKQAGSGTLPKLVFPRTTVVGEVSSAATITNLVQSNLNGG